MNLRQTASRSKRNLLDRREARAEQVLYSNYQKIAFSGSEDLIEAHFSTWSEPDHTNRPGFEAALKNSNARPLNIIETGTSAWGTDSTRLWDAYVQHFGGEFWSVDLSTAPSKRLKNQVSQHTHLIVSDSVSFLQDFAKDHVGENVDICYLDSWDVDWQDPEPSMEHGLAEFHAVEKLLGPGSVLLIDDTPTSLEDVPPSEKEAAASFLALRGFLPGKGALIVQELEARSDIRAVWKGYSVAFEFR
jgi:hypothetical protein